MDNVYKLIRSFKYAFQGLRSGFRTQLNFRVQCGLAVVAIAGGLVLNITKNEWLWISLSVALVLFAELMNTALEAMVDLVSPQYNELAGRIKDIAAAAVTILAANALITAAIIFVPLIIHLLRP